MEGGGCCCCSVVCFSVEAQTEVKVFVSGFPTIISKSKNNMMIMKSVCVPRLLLGVFFNVKSSAGNLKETERKRVIFPRTNYVEVFIFMGYVYVTTSVTFCSTATTVHHMQSHSLM